MCKILWGMKIMLKKIITVIVTVQLLFLNIFSNAAPVHAMLEYDDLDKSILSKSMEKASNAAYLLFEDVFDDEAAADSKVKWETICSVFNTAKGAFSSVTPVIGGINATVTFLRLLGVMKDPTAQKFADIKEQLGNMNRKLNEMDNKLNEITNQMSKIQASIDFNTRTTKAIAMQNAWRDFELNYIENKLDNLMTIYQGKLTDGVKAWCEDSDSRYSTTVNTDKIFLLYLKDSDGEYKLVPNLYNNKPDDLPEDARYVVLNHHFLPDSLKFNVDNYRKDIKKHISDAFRFCFEHDLFDYIESQNIPELTSEGMDGFTEEFANNLTDDAVDTLVYRIAAVEVNKDSSFALQVRQAFDNYCNHLLKAEEGFDARVKAMYLTHAFEYQIEDEYRIFCNEMIVKTGVYGLFVSNVLNMSDSIPAVEKRAALLSMADAIDKLDEAVENGLTGVPNFCFITETALYLGKGTINSEGSAVVHTAGNNAYDEKCDISAMTLSFDGSWPSDYKPSVGSMLGDTDMILLNYVLQASGGNTQFDYLNDNLGSGRQENLDLILTSTKQVAELGLDYVGTLKPVNIFGDYFAKADKVTFSNLPSSADKKYIAMAKKLEGTTFEMKTGKLESNRLVNGMAVYGESHWYWSTDELAILCAGLNGSHYNTELYDGPEDHYSEADHKSYYYKCVKLENNYNVLIKIPVDFGNNADEYDPLDDLEEMNDEVYNQHEHVWDEGVIIKEPTCGEFGEKLHTCKDDENHIWIEYIDTLEHDWSDWEITKEPKGDEPGERRRVCKNDPTHVEVEIYPKPEDGCILTFDLGDGYIGEATGVQEIRAKIGTELTMPDGPVKEGYKFLYWQGSEYYPGDKFIVEGAHTFTAVYEKEQNPLSPQTGDDSNLCLWMALSLTSTCCFCYVISRKRKSAYTN